MCVQHVFIHRREAKPESRIWPGSAKSSGLDIGEGGGGLYVTNGKEWKHCYMRCYSDVVQQRQPLRQDGG